jgi:DNA-binding NarL/FixJ family response regulator
VRVGLADDSELFRSGLAALLSASGVRVVLQVGSGRELLDRADLSQLDAVIVDIRMPPTFTEEGLDAADQLGLSHPRLAVLVLSTYAETAYAVRVFQHGSARRGYLLKDALDHPEALRDALERLRAGGSVLDGSIVRRLMGSTRCSEAFDRLTGRQRSILRLVAQGYAEVHLAAALELDEAATRVQIDAALGELGIRCDDPSERMTRLLSWLRSEPFDDVGNAGPESGNTSIRA